MTDKPITLNQMLADWKWRAEETDLHNKETLQSIEYTEKLRELIAQGLRWGPNTKPEFYQREDGTTYYKLIIRGLNNTNYVVEK